MNNWWFWPIPIGSIIGLLFSISLTLIRIEKLLKSRSAEGQS
jgi:hypothetical protein